MSALERFVAYQAENIGHADEDARLEWECLIAEMCDENAKLREERDMYRDLVGNMVHPDIPDQLYAENSKLRELAVEMYWDLVAEMPESLLTDRKQQLKELGIEVDA